MRSLTAVARWVLPVCIVVLTALAAAPPAEATPNVRILAVDPANNRVYLKNFGTSDQIMTNWWLCDFPSYSQFSATLGPGEVVGLTFNIDNDSEMGLYINSSFASPSSMVDYVDWGTAGGGRSGVAVSAGLWPSGDVVGVAPPFGYTGDGSQRGAAFWSTGQANIRIVEADTDANSLRLRNYGTATQDVSSWWLCSLFAYVQHSTLPVLEGSPARQIEPGEDLVVMWPNVDASPRDMGLYSTASFGSAAAMVDFLQWGSGGNGRENVAVNAGYWGTGDFIPGTTPFEFVGGGTDRGVTFWTSVQPGAGSVPDGELIPGQQLTIGPAGDGDLALSWGASCRAGDGDYGIYEGTLGGDFTSHVGVLCSTAGATAATITPAGGSSYYLVVPRNGSVEGGYGSGAAGPRDPGGITCAPSNPLACE